MDIGFWGFPFKVRDIDVLSLEDPYCPRFLTDERIGVRFRVKDDVPASV